MLSRAPLHLVAPLLGLLLIAGLHLPRKTTAEPAGKRALALSSAPSSTTDPVGPAPVLRRPAGSGPDSRGERVSTPVLSSSTPTISAPSPASGTVKVTARASSRGLVRLEVHVDGAFAAACATSPCGYAWRTGTITNGYHTLTARRYDIHGGITTSAPLDVSVTNLTPVVSLTAPDVASGAILISASASDSGGVRSLSVALDGSQIAASRASPLSFSWDSTQVADGPHALQATAVDASGNVGQSVIVPVLVSNGPGGVTPVPIPGLSQWASKMVTYAQIHCDDLAEAWQHTWDQNLTSVYYDQTRVMYQIADYTQDAHWEACAKQAVWIYRDTYVLPNGGEVPGYWNFSTGLRIDVERTGDALSSQAAVLLSTQASYTRDTDNPCTAQSLSREAAYALLALQNAERLGEPHRARRDVLRESVYGHFTQWLAHPATGQLSPFMMGLSAHSVIRDWEETRDARAVPTLRAIADWLWANAWDPASRSMWYDLNAFPRQAAPDLNLLIAPLYAWLYAQTGDPKYRDEGDQLFVGGVEGAWLDGGKQFDQNYWWSFDYVTWRNGR